MNTNNYYITINNNLSSINNNNNTQQQQNNINNNNLNLYQISNNNGIAQPSGSYLHSPSQSTFSTPSFNSLIGEFTLPEFTSIAREVKPLIWVHSTLEDYQSNNSGLSSQDFQSQNHATLTSQAHRIKIQNLLNPQ